MNRNIIAGTAAALLALSLAACGTMDSTRETGTGTNVTDTNVTDANGVTERSNTGRPAGTAYHGSTATGPVNRHYPGSPDAATAEPRLQNPDVGHGRYLAGSDGRVRGMQEDAGEQARELGRDVKQGVDNAVDGAGRAVERTGEAIQDIT